MKPITEKEINQNVQIVKNQEVSRFNLYTRGRQANYETIRKRAHQLNRDRNKFTSSGTPKDKQWSSSNDETNPKADTGTKILMFLIIVFIFVGFIVSNESSLDDEHRKSLERKRLRFKMNVSKED